MCTEPEVMVPVVTSSCQQLVLLGDQHQLSPTLRLPARYSLGLEKSLFERYSGKALTLSMQYRMVMWGWGSLHIQKKRNRKSHFHRAFSSFAQRCLQSVQQELLGEEGRL